MRELTAAETTVSATILGGMSVLQTRSRFATFVICLVAAFQTHAAPLRLRPGWDDLREIVRHTELSPRIVMRTGPDGKSRIKGKLTGITCQSARKMSHFPALGQAFGETSGVECGGARRLTVTHALASNWYRA